LGFIFDKFEKIKTDFVVLLVGDHHELFFFWVVDDAFYVTDAELGVDIAF
jgi:hypothetical protein